MIQILSSLFLWIKVPILLLILLIGLSIESLHLSHLHRWLTLRHHGLLMHIILLLLLLHMHRHGLLGHIWLHGLLNHVLLHHWLLALWGSEYLQRVKHMRLVYHIKEKIHIVFPEATLFDNILYLEKIHAHFLCLSNELLF